MMLLLLSIHMLKQVEDLAHMKMSTLSKFVFMMSKSRAKIINELSQSYKKSLTFSFDEIVCLKQMISIVSYPSLFSCTTSRTCRESS